ncbi:MAG TPA: TonB family protein [Prolixibacteraceae bacterium]
MAANNNIFSNAWCELVFAAKNHEYGAYELRKNSSRRHLRALIIASVVFVFIVSTPILLRQIMPKTVEKDVSVRTLSDIKIDKPKEDEIVREIPPPPPVRNTIKFIPPVIKPDEMVADEEQPVTQKEVIETKAAVSNVVFDKGTDDVAAPVATVNNQITEEADLPFFSVEQMPQFPGGELEMIKFIRNNLRYPPLAMEMNVSGTVLVNFVIDRDGKITRIKVIRGIGKGCDEEAVRVLSKMPDWSPGKQGGRAVLVSYTLPFKFMLN